MLGKKKPQNPKLRRTYRNRYYYCTILSYTIFYYTYISSCYIILHCDIILYYTILCYTKLP